MVPSFPIVGLASSARGLRGPRTLALAYGLCFVVSGGGVALAVAGLLGISLPLMLAGTVLWLLGGAAWELATGRFR